MLFSILANNSETLPASPTIWPARLGQTRDKGGQYIIQHIALLVWARKLVVRFAPLVRLTPRSPTKKYNFFAALRYFFSERGSTNWPVCSLPPLKKTAARQWTCQCPWVLKEIPSVCHGCPSKPDKVAPACHARVTAASATVPAWHGAFKTRQTHNHDGSPQWMRIHGVRDGLFRRRHPGGGAGGMAEDLARDASGDNRVLHWFLIVFGQTDRPGILQSAVTALSKVKRCFESGRSCHGNHRRSSMEVSGGFWRFRSHRNKAQMLLHQPANTVGISQVKRLLR